MREAWATAGVSDALLFAWTQKEPIGGVSGVILAFFYFGAAWLAHVAARRTPDSRAWRVFSYILLALGINKPFDFQVLVTRFARGQALSEGWYGRRRVFQAAMILLVLALSAVVVVVGGRMVRRSHEILLPFATIVYLLTLLLVRAISLHQVDAVMTRWRVFGLRVGLVLELMGIVTMILTTAFAIRRARRR
jgi:hypothetical protein